MYLLLLSLLLFASAAEAEEAPSGTMEHPMRLDCRNLGAVIAARQGEGAVVSGALTVVAEDDGAVPPVVLGCPGKRHIVCVMETPSGARTGARLSLAGRLSAIGSNYAMVDPCGVHRE